MINFEYYDLKLTKYNFFLKSINFVLILQKIKRLRSIYIFLIHIKKKKKTLFNFINYEI
jgi:hypothetical protein